MEISQIAELMHASKIVEKPIAEIKEYQKNSRLHSEEQISQVMASIKAFGFTQPVLLDQEGTLIAGHCRVTAAKRLGLLAVPSITLGHLSKAETRALLIVDNRLAENGRWDNGLLASEIKELKLQSFDVELLGFDKAEIKSFLADPVIKTDGLTDPDEVPEEVETRCKSGELWQLGNHRLLVGDSTSAGDVARLFDNGGGHKLVAELCFTSPPYSDQREYRGGKELSTQHLAKFISTAAQFVNLFAVNLGISRKDGEVSTYWDDYIAEARSCGLKLLSWNVWDRFNACSLGQQTAMFPIEHEWIFIFGEAIKNLNRTIPNKTAGGKHSQGSNREIDGSMSGRRVEITRDFRPLGTVVRLDVHRGEAPHPAMFPSSLPESYIEASTKNNDIVYEPFTGSGTTFIASEKSDRVCFGIEIDPHYADVAVARWEKFTGLTANKLS